MVRPEDIRVSVIIPVYRDGLRLEKCVQALEKQTFPKENFEVLVVNNDPDEVPMLPPSSILLKLLNEFNPGSYAARNTGIRHARGDLIAFTDSDCIPDRDWLKNAVEAFADRNIERIGGKIEQFAENESHSNAVCQYQKFFAFDQKTYIHKRGYSVTANLVVRKEVFERVGLFNDELMSGGDFEFGTRATRSGVSLIYDPKVIVNHPIRSTLKDLVRKKRRVKGGDYDIRKNKPTLKYLLISLLPPFQKWGKLDQNLHLLVKLNILGIAWLIKLAEASEWLRLVYFDKPRLRR